jgi:hypothetical protein
MKSSNLRKSAVVLALAALGISASVATDAVADVPAPMHRGAKKKAKKKLSVQLERVDVVRSPTGDNPFGGIAPCTLVLRTIYEAALAGTPYALRFHLRYRSGKHTAVKHAVVPVKNMHLRRTQPSDARYVRLDTVIDVSKKPVNEGAAVNGKVKLQKSKSARGAAFDEDELESMDIELVLL